MISVGDYVQAARHHVAQTAKFRHIELQPMSLSPATIQAIVRIVLR